MWHLSNSKATANMARRMQRSRELDPRPRASRDDGAGEPARERHVDAEQDEERDRAERVPSEAVLVVARPQEVDDLVMSISLHVDP